MLRTHDRIKKSAKHTKFIFKINSNIIYDI